MPANYSHTIHKVLNKKAMLASLGFVDSWTITFQIYFQKSSSQIDFYTVIGTTETTMTKKIPYLCFTWIQCIWDFLGKYRNPMSKQQCVETEETVVYLRVRIENNYISSFNLITRSFCLGQDAIFYDVWRQFSVKRW